jgi:nucleoside-diphosphate-sugar epimerase
MKKIGIIGHSGFIGSALAKTFKAKYIYGLNSKTLDFNSLSQMIVACNSVVLAGSEITPFSAEKNRLLQFKELEIIDQIATISSTYKKNIHIHLLSSAGALYTNHDMLFNDYATFKLRQEVKLAQLFDKFSVYRISNAYGPGQRLGKNLGVINEWIHQILSINEIKIFGDTSIKKDFIYIDDLINLLKKAVEKPANGIFNVGSGALTNLNEVVQILKELNPSFIIKREPQKNYDNSSSDFQINRTCETFNWHSKVDLRVGIKHLYSYHSNLYSGL